MTKSSKKRLSRVLAVLMSVAMLVTALPADLLGGIASVKAETKPAYREYTSVYNFRDESIIPASTSGVASYTSADGKLIAATGNQNGFGTDGLSGGHGITFKTGNNITIHVLGPATINIGACQYSEGAFTVMNGETELANTTVAKNDKSCYKDDNSQVYSVEYTGTEETDIVLTVTSGKLYIPEVTVDRKEPKALIQRDSVYSFSDESIIPASTSGVASYNSADGMLTAATGNQNGFGTDGLSGGHGITFKTGNNITIHVLREATIDIGACQYSEGAFTVMNGETELANVTVAKNDKSCYKDDKTQVYSVEYTGTEETDIVLTVTSGKVYIPEIVVHRTEYEPDVTEVTATVSLTGSNLLQEGDKVTLTNAADSTDVVDVTEGGDFTLAPNAVYNVSVDNTDIKATVDGKTSVATLTADLEIVIDLVATVVNPTVTISDPDSVLGEAVLSLTNMADDSDKHNLANGETVKLKIGASYLIESDVDSVDATINGKKTLTVGKDLTAFTVNVSAADTTHHTIDVWDFGVETLANTETITYNNNLTPELVIAWYEGLTKADGTPYAAGDVVPSNVLGYDKDNKARKLDAGNGLYLNGEQSKANKWRHRGVKTLETIPNERNEDSLIDEFNQNYQAIMYSNAGTTAGQDPYTWMELDVEAGDIVYLVVASNGTDSDITFKSPSGKDVQKFTFTRASRTKLQNTSKFYAAETGTYKIYSANEKLVVARIYRETPNTVTVSGSITIPEGKAIGEGKLIFTNTTTGQEIEATVDGTSYTVSLKEQYTYDISLVGSGDLIVGTTNSVTLKNEAGDTNYDIELVKVDLVNVSGSLAALSKEAVANLELTFSSENIYVPEAVIDADALTYTAKFEKGVTYTVSEAGVNDYTLETTSISADADNSALPIVFAKKPVYAINVTLDGPTAEEAANVALTFSNINEEGYVYNFTGTNGIALRDGQYKVTAVLEGYKQKVTADVKVKGAAVDMTITMLSTAAPAPIPYKETVTVGATGCDYTTINDALDAVRLMTRGEEDRVTIAIQPGDYQEMLVVDVPNVTLKNASSTPTNLVKDKGVNIDANAVRITSYYGHGYTYYSMGADYKYDADLLAANKENGYPSTVNPGSGTGTYWNATVQITAEASGFRAENIIFENSFNQYVSTKAAEDEIVPQGGAKGESNGKRNDMKAGDTSVQQKAYVERAAALALEAGVSEAFFDGCRIIGKQDTLYGGEGTTAAFYNCAVYGGTDYIFGGMTAVFAKCDLVLHTTDDNNDVAYITAAQQKSKRGYLMYNCNVVNTTPGVDTIATGASKPCYFGRPWEGITSEVVFFYTVVGVANDGTSLIAPDGWSNSLGGKSDKCYEYGTYEMAENVNNSSARVTWSHVLTEPKIGEEIITVPKFLGAWDAFAGKDMTIVIPGQNPIEEPTDPADDDLKGEPTSFVLDTTADLTAFAQGAKKDGDAQKAGTNQFFTMIYSAKTKVDGSNKTWDDGYAAAQRVNFGGAVVDNTAQPANGKYMNAVKFTTEYPATVKVWWAEGGDDNRQVVIKNEAGADVAKTEGTFTKNSAYISEFKLDAAGTYYLGGLGGNNYFFKVQVDLKKPAEPVVSVLDTAADLTAFATGAKADGDSEKAGTKKYFTLIYSAKSKVDGSNKTWEDGYASAQRVNFGGAVIANTAADASAGKYMNAIKFTTENPATVKVWWAEGGDDNRQIVIMNEAGAEAAKTDGTFTKNSAYISEFKLDAADTYYLGGSGGNNYIFKVEVTETPGGAPEIIRADWADVSAPDITAVALDPEDAAQIVVTVTGLVGVDGGDRVDVDMIDEKGDVVDSVGSAVQEQEERNIIFTPAESGSYTFVARLSRAGEEDKVSEETEAFAFKLPIGTPIIKSVTNKGLGADKKGTLEISWGKVTEARQYEVTITKLVADPDETPGDAAMKPETVAEVKTTDVKTLIGGLEVGDYVTVYVVASGVNGKSKAAVANATIKEEAERTWSFSAYGSSVNTANNGFIKNADGSVTVYSEGGKGKVVPGSTDGLAYYYTTIDPTNENFTMTVDVHVDSWKLSNGQEGFGIMVADAVGEPGDGTAFWNNSYQLFATKIEYNTLDGALTDAAFGTSGVVKHSGKLGLGWISKEGTTVTDVSQITAGERSTPELFASKSGTLETSAVAVNPNGGSFNIVGNYTGSAPAGTLKELTDFKMQIQRNNDGYILRYLTAEGEVIGEKTFYDDSRINLTQIDKKNIYVGFVASRNARATFSNLDLKTINPNDDAPASAKETEYVDLACSVTSPKTANGFAYEFGFQANANGKLSVLLEDEVVVADAQITANKVFKVGTTLHSTGDNKFVYNFVPDADYVPGENKKLTSYEPVTESFHVSCSYFMGSNTIYVANNGTPNNFSPTKTNPTDIYTAVAYARPGNKIYLMEGTYDLSNVVLIEKKHDGTAEEPIWLMADPEASTRPVLDFAGQTAETSAFTIAANYWHLKGFDVTNSLNAQKGIQVSGSYNVVEDVRTYRNGNTGIQIARYLNDGRAEWPAYNTILNCTSYLNADAGYEDADGFAAKLTCGEGNRFVGCISAYNADDGWDLFAKVQTGSIGAVTIDRCLAFGNGYLTEDGVTITDAGNGNGFKMGGDSMSGHHVIMNSVAFGNKAKGIDSNSCPDIEVYNCTSFDNGSYNVALYTNTAVNTDYNVDGVLSVRSKAGETEQLKLVGSQNRAKVYGPTNYYCLDGSKSVNANGEEASIDWFVKTDMNKAINDRVNGITRNADGTINMNGFLVLNEKAPAGVGAVIGSTAISDVIVEVPVIAVFAANVTTLKDVALPAELVEAGYAWKYPETATKAFAGTAAELIASAEGKEDRAVIVNFVELTGLHTDVYSYPLYKGDSAGVFIYAQMAPEVDEDIAIAGFEDAKFNITITDNSKLGLVAEESGEGAYKQIVYTMNDDSKTGTAKYTATLTATLGGKTVKKTANYSFDVLNAYSYIDYTMEYVDAEGNVDPENTFQGDGVVFNGEKRHLVASAVGLSKTDVNVSVSDSKILAFDKSTSMLVAKKAGVATVTLTAAADKKVKTSFIVKVIDNELTTNVANLTLDRAKTSGAIFTLRSNTGDEVVGFDALAIKSVTKGGKEIASDNFTVEHVVGDLYKLNTAEDDKLTTGNYVVTLKAVSSEAEFYVDAINVKVIETKPAVTIKQTKKVNLFYTAGSVSGNGALTASSKQAAVTLVQTEADKADYKLISAKNGYNVVLKGGKTGKNKKITATVSFAGYKARYDKDINITVATVKQAPKLKVEVDNKVLYTKLGIKDTVVRIYNTTTGTYVVGADVALASSKSAYVKANKNFALSKEGAEYVLVADKSGTAKISVQDGDWTEEVILNQAITVNKNEPTVTARALTLNKNYAGKEAASTVLTVKNALDYKVKNFELTGKNAKAAKVLESMDYSVEIDDKGQNVLTVSLKDGAEVKAGSYSFKATFDLNKLTGKTMNITVKVVDKVTVSTKQSGKINLINRAGTAVTVKPTIKNLNGKVIGMTLGQDASNQFDVAWDATKGAAVITAKQGIDLKKGTKYIVAPTFQVETAYGVVEVEGKTFSIVPTQTAVKTSKVDPIEMKLSHDYSVGTAEFKATSPANAEILGIEQLDNYDNFYVEYDSVGDQISVWMNSANMKPNKVYKVKVALYVEDSATNVKPQVVTIPIKTVQ